MGLESIGSSKRKETIDDVEKRRKKLKIALHVAILGYLAANPGESVAGKREAARIADGLKTSHVEPSTRFGDEPKDDPRNSKVKWRIRE